MRILKSKIARASKTTHYFQEAKINLKLEDSEAISDTTCHSGKISAVEPTITVKVKAESLSRTRKEKAPLKVVMKREQSSNKANKNIIRNYSRATINFCLS